MITRSQFAASAPWLAAAPLALAGCAPAPAADGYEAVAERIWQPVAVTDLVGAALGRELVRCATLAPSSHNTQCWKFVLGADGRSISILPDLARRCPAVDAAHWVEVGRCYERFALQATALGIRNAFLNQPIKAAALRPPFAAALGPSGQRPDLVVRFGRGPLLPALAAAASADGAGVNDKASMLRECASAQMDSARASRLTC